MSRTATQGRGWAVATPAKVGAYRHKHLVADLRQSGERLASVMGELIRELGTQGRQARPSLERVAVLTATGATEVAKLRRLADELHGLLGTAGTEPDALVELQAQVVELRERVERLGG